MLQHTDQRFVVKGGKQLHGTVTVSGAKNATLPIVCAALLTKETSTLTNVPDISDVRNILGILEGLGAKIKFSGGQLTIDPSHISLEHISEDLVCSMRASILLLGPLLARCSEVALPFPGGCVLGKRPVASHTHALHALGAEIIDETTKLHLRLPTRHPATITMPEISVTATENALMLAAVTPGKTVIRLAAAEPQVQDLCHFLVAMGAKIEGIGSHFLEIEGQQELHGAEHNIGGDYLEVGTFAVASLVTQSEVLIQGFKAAQLDSFWQKLDEAGARYELSAGSVRILPTPKLQAIHNLRTAVYPSFATDLQAPFAVLLTQAEGDSHIFETLFDGRLQYLYELEKMGAKVEVHNPHQATVHGPCRLQGGPISSLDLRAGAAMVLAALCAEGTSEISNINYIDRGYERFEEKLQALGADIKREKI